MSGVRMFGVEFMLEQNKPKIIQYAKAYMNGMKAKDIIIFMSSNEPFPVSDDIIELLSEYKEVVKLYNPRNATQMFLEIIGEARPDILTTIMAFEEDGAKWALRSITNVYERILDIKPEHQKVQFRCPKCESEITLTEDKLAMIKQCPFCNTPIGGEQDGLPADTNGDEQLPTDEGTGV